MIDFLKRAAARDLPEFLYRVFHNGSVSRFDEGSGISSGNPTMFLNTRDDAYVALKNHLNKNNRTPTPFISTYSDSRKAKRLADTWQERGERGVTIVIIDVEEWRELEWRELESWRVLEMSRALNYFKFSLPTSVARDATECEYLVLREIPPEAIRRVCPAEDFI